MKWEDALKFSAGCQLQSGSETGSQALVGPPRKVSKTMNQNTPILPKAQVLTERAFSTVSRFLHIEAVSGMVLLLAAAVALIWANSPWADSYHALWHTSFSIGLGEYVFDRPLHFWINDALMTLFFLVVGMEIRREMHEGALSDIRQAMLPIAAAFGGVAAPALIYVAFNSQSPQSHGWAVPTATDIAFAVGVLALLGRSIPSNIRVFLLALAIIDDIVAVLIIAFFYSGGLDYSGFLVVALGIAMVLGLQHVGIGSAYAYVIPGLIIWGGVLMTGAHPTLAGVVLGLMTPVLPSRRLERPMQTLERVVQDLRKRRDSVEPEELAHALSDVRRAQRDMLAPVTRVQMALHTWVAFGVMPLFALANAGVSFDGIDLSQDGANWVMVGVIAALVLGKPIGIMGVSWLMVALKLCKLPEGVSWSGIALIGLLAGIGFTMSIFIAMLAFVDESLLGAAKLGVLTASLLAAILGLSMGAVVVRSVKRNAAQA